MEKEKTNSLLKVVILGILFIFIFSTAVIFGGIIYFSRDLPDLSSVIHYKPYTVNFVYSDEGEVIGDLSVERRVLIPREKIPKMLVDAFLAAEDAGFYEHEGISLTSIARAFLKNLTAGEIVQGGSTITQQVVKSFLLSPEKTVTRKVKEAILAYKIEKFLGKDEILYLYLNQIYFGQGAYGIEAASQTYFGKHCYELALNEAAFLAGLPQAPSRYSPYSNPKRARERQLYVLKRMAREEFITESEMRKAASTPLKLKPKDVAINGLAPYLIEHLRGTLEEKYGKENIAKGGYKIYTTIDSKMQKAANEAVKKGIKEVDKRLGFRGPIKQISEKEIEKFLQETREKLEDIPLKAGETHTGVVIKEISNEGYILKVSDTLAKLVYKDMQWAGKSVTEKGKTKNVPPKLKVGDVIKVKIEEAGATLKVSLDQEPVIQGALLAMDPNTGMVKAVVGGYDFTKSQFNRALTAKRQPGSSFKPIIYTAALDKGFNPASILIDTPVSFDHGFLGKTWNPKNFKNEYVGPTTLRDALIHSRNVCSVKLLQEIGVGYVIDYAVKLGISSPISSDLSIALGSSSVSLLEMATSYSVFASGGMRPKPMMLVKVVDPSGKEEFFDEPEVTPVISPETASIITSILQGVIQQGTGQRGKALGRPAAGKTGTTNDHIDAWFVGYTPQVVASVWVGYDDRKPIGSRESGGAAATPIWTYFMKDALAPYPVENFPVPEGVELKLMNSKTGEIGSGNDYQLFRKGDQLN